MNIGIGKRSFVIDDDAYYRLQAYLEDFRNELGGAYGSEEVMEDLEMRIADIFTESVGHSGVVSLSLVDSVIARMGMPNGPYKGASASAAPQGHARKRLYRNSDDRVLAGVCSGLAAYLGIDAVLVRVIFVLLVILGCSGLLIYLIFWIIAPEARTPAEKCEMYGIEPNAENMASFRRGTRR